jgi:hypothetical protein
MLTGSGNERQTSSPVIKKKIIKKRKKIYTDISRKNKQPLRPLKNLVKNYGRAICSFACESISDVYLESIVSKNNIYPKITSALKPFANTYMNKKTT